jgi:hypothetical protein
LFRSALQARLDVSSLLHIRAAKCRFVPAQSLSFISLHDLDPLLEGTEHFRGSLRRDREDIADVKRKPLELYFASRALLSGERAECPHPISY